MSLYIVAGAPTLFYQQGNYNSCILSYLTSALHYMGDDQKSLLEIQNKGLIHFCRDILMGHHKEINEKRINYSIEEWHTFTPYDILCDKSTYPNVCLLLDMWNQTDHCIKFCGKWIFDSNFEVEFPLTQDCLNFTCRGNDTDEIKFVGVLHMIIIVPPEVVKED